MGSSTIADSTNTSSSSRHPRFLGLSSDNVERRTLTLRLIYIASMVAAAAIVGVLAYTLTLDMEENVGEQTYESIALGALEEAKAIAQRKQHGGDILSSIWSYSFPDESQWPNQVGLKGYTTIANKVAKQSSTSGHGMMVVVRPEEVKEFEQHAKQLYQDYEYPETAGYSDFGFGIYKKDPNSTTNEDGRVHDISGNTTYGSERQIMVPFLQHSNAFRNPDLLMMNLYAQPFRGNVLDSIIDCSEQAADPKLLDDDDDDDDEAESPSCGVVTDFVEIFVRPGPAAVFFQPIYPANNRTSVVGFIGTSIHWEEVLTNVVPDYVDGLNFVISNGNKAFTFVIHEGTPELVGEGDLHDNNFDRYAHTITLSHVEETGALESSTYILTVYPTAPFFEQFHTSSPMNISLGFVAVILICSALFFLYDYFMQYESHQRKKILEMKRRFVRYVSHEVRTPLNVVSMGLELLMTDLREEINKTNNENVSTKNQLTGNGHRSNVEAQELKESAPGKVIPKPNAEINTNSASYWLDLLGDILENTQNAISVLNDLLNYDKVESKTFNLEYGLVDISELIRKTMSEFQIQAKNRKVALELRNDNNDNAGASTNEAEARRDRDVAALRVLGDDIRLTQVIRNLLSNAIKFSPELDGEIAVTVSYVEDGLPNAELQRLDVSRLETVGERSGAIRIAVEDNGVGLTKDQLKGVFSEGVQFDANKLQHGGGSGLGLAITREIVLQHGGTIEVTSDGRGCGTTFVVEIPLFLKKQGEKNDEDMGTNQTVRTDSTGLSARMQHQHILVVDDVFSNTKMLVRLLERAGHTCTVACNGQEAIDVYLSNEERAAAGGPFFDTVLMDYEMPVMNGPDATKRLREMGCDAFIIGVTGNLLADDVSHFKASGADYVLPKPVTLAAIEASWLFLETERRQPITKAVDHKDIFAV